MDEQKILSLLLSTNQQDVEIGAEFIGVSEEYAKYFIEKYGAIMREVDLRVWSDTPLSKKYISRKELRSDIYVTSKDKKKDYYLSIGAFGVVLLKS